MEEKEKKDSIKYMVITGGIIGLIQAIIGFANIAAWIYPLGYFLQGALFVANIFSSIIGIILAILTLLGVFRPGNPIPYSAAVLLIFGFLMLFFNAAIGGIIVFIAGILWLAWKP